MRSRIIFQMFAFAQTHKLYSVLKESVGLFFFYFLHSFALGFLCNAKYMRWTNRFRKHVNHTRPVWAWAHLEIKHYISTRCLSWFMINVENKCRGIWMGQTGISIQFRSFCLYEDLFFKKSRTISILKTSSKSEMKKFYSLSIYLKSLDNKIDEK